MIRPDSISKQGGSAGKTKFHVIMHKQPKVIYASAVHWQCRVLAMVRSSCTLGLMALIRWLIARITQSIVIPYCPHKHHPQHYHRIHHAPALGARQDPDAITCKQIGNANVDAHGQRSHFGLRRRDGHTPR